MLNHVGVAGAYRRSILRESVHDLLRPALRALLVSLEAI